METHWPVLLFNKSVLKQRKFNQITALLGETDQKHCLDIGSDNGVISYLLRQRGGIWKSADLDKKTVESIRDLVKEDVFQIDGLRTCFNDDEFDRVIIVDFLEHINTDREFINELFRIIKPGGELIINIPHIKNSLLRKFRVTIGQTDEKHGHVRPGYDVVALAELLNGKFTILSYRTYSKFFSECVDTLITFGIGVIRKEDGASPKGVVLTGKDLDRAKKSFMAYSLLYPFVWFISRLDYLLPFNSGYMLIAKVRINKK